MLSTWCILGAFWNLYCWRWLLILGINNMILQTSLYNVNVNYVCRNFPVSCTYIYVSTFTFTLIQVNIYIYIYGIIGFVALIAYGTWSVFNQFAANIPNSYKYVFFMRKKTRYFYSGGSTLADCPGTKKLRLYQKLWAI